MIRVLKGLVVGAASLVFCAPSLSASCVVPDEVSVTPADQERIDKFAAARVRSLSEAMKAASASEKQILQNVVGAATVPIDELPMGLYKCRVIKMGGHLPITIYNYFECHVSDMSTWIEKLSGSQLFMGTLNATGQGAILYRGAMNYQNEPTATYYGDNAERDQVGCLFEIAGSTPRYRLELPLPVRESTFDVIELVPSN